MSTDNNNLPALVQQTGALQTFQNNMQVDLSMVADAAIAPLETRLDEERRKALQEKNAINKTQTDAAKTYAKECDDFVKTLQLTTREKLDEELNACDDKSVEYCGTTVQVDVREHAVILDTNSAFRRSADLDEDYQLEEEIVISQTISRTIHQPVPQFVRDYNAGRKERTKRLAELDENLVKIANAENRLPTLARQTRAVVANKMLGETDIGKQVLSDLQTHQAQFMDTLGLK